MESGTIFPIRIANFHLLFSILADFIFLHIFETDSKSIVNTLFWISITLIILLYSTSIFISFVLSNSENKFNTLWDIIFPPFVSLVFYMFGDFDFYIKKMKLDEIPKINVIYITWMINSICELFIQLPKSYIFFLFEENIKEKQDIYKQYYLVLAFAKYMALIGVFKGIIASVLALINFVKVILNDNYTFLDSKTNIKDDLRNSKKKN